MYPYELFWGIDLYVVFLCVAVVAAIVVYRLLADKLQIKAKLQNFCMYTAVGSVIIGYLSAVLFQGLYNIATYGKFYIRGATFYGGLIGGAGFFLLIYFGVGRFVFKDGEHIKSFFKTADIAACSISIAHAFGRIGCLMAGCCHGKMTTAWYGIKMANLGYKVVPTQLFEALFLLFLFTYLVLRIRDKQTYCLQIYICTYGVWRYIVEFMRDDYRGTTVIESVTPSQFIAILMLLGGAALIYLQHRLQSNSEAAEDKKISKLKKAAEAIESDDDGYSAVYSNTDKDSKSDSQKDETDGNGSGE